MTLQATGLLLASALFTQEAYGCPVMCFKKRRSGYLHFIGYFSRKNTVECQ